MKSAVFVRIIWVFLFLHINECAMAQLPFFRDQQFQKINSSASINCLQQDREGRIWLGTTGGLYCFDGYEYKKAGGEDASQNNVSAMVSLSDGTLLAGTKSGKLFKVTQSSFIPVVISDYKNNHSITAIIQDDTNEIWIATYGNGIFKWNDKQLIHYHIGNGLADNYVYSITKDKSNRLWAGTDNGLACIKMKGDSAELSRFGIAQGLPDNIITSVTLGPEGKIWAGTFEKGVVVFDNEKERFYVPENFKNWAYGHINCMVLLENEFWICTENKGIIDYEFSAPGRFRVIENDQLHGNRSVASMIIDDASNVWVAAGNVLLFTPGERIEFLQKLCGEPAGNIRAILSDNHGFVWVGSQNGVKRFYSDAFGAVICDQPLSASRYAAAPVISFHEDKYGRIWMGTFDYGVIVYDKNSGRIGNLSTKDGLQNESVLSIDGSGDTLWLGTLGGVAGCTITPDFPERSNVSFFLLPGKGSGTHFIYKVFEDSHNRLLAGTDGDGLGIYFKNRYNNFKTSLGLKSGVVYSITEDLTDNIWIFVSGGGLYRINGNDVTNFNKESGLSDMSIASVISDQFGNIIAVNKTGIDIVDSQTGQVITFGESLGVEDIDPELNCVSHDNYGNTWIGTKDGIIKLRLGEKVSSLIPKTHLSEVLCFLEPVDKNVITDFPHNRNHISFEFGTIWYDHPDAVGYKYILDGYNTEWVTTRDRFITFPNLAPGTYKFRLMSGLNGNFSHAEEVSYSFTINPPFYRLVWFQSLLLLLFMGLLVAIIRYRESRTMSIEAINKERAQAQFEVLRNQVNPHFLFNSFNTLISIIEDDREKAIDYVNKMSDFFRRILTHKEKDLISLMEEVGLLNDYLFLQKQRYGDGFIIENNLPEGKDAERIMLPPLSLQMLAENVFKHNAVSTKVPLRIEIFINDSGNIVFRNNKVRRMKAEPSTGTGLSNLSNRYRLLCGQEPVIHDNFDSFTVILPVIKTKR